MNAEFFGDKYVSRDNFFFNFRAPENSLVTSPFEICVRRFDFHQNVLTTVIGPVVIPCLRLDKFPEKL